MHNACIFSYNKKKKYVGFVYTVQNAEIYMPKGFKYARMC